MPVGRGEPTRASSANPQKACLVTRGAAECCCCLGQQTDDPCSRAAYMQIQDCDFQCHLAPVVSSLLHRCRTSFLPALSGIIVRIGPRQPTPLFRPRDTPQ
ncbi:hypothetical protein Bbelb_404790 [Branchiostoma belcheri]|nr:hypothetical protein Bbelb_404790 [Branchiostoma belcheri]